MCSRNVSGTGNKSGMYSLWNERHSFRFQVHPLVRYYLQFLTDTRPLSFHHKCVMPVFLHLQARFAGSSCLQNHHNLHPTWKTGPLSRDPSRLKTNRLCRRRITFPDRATCEPYRAEQRFAEKRSATSEWAA
jgi:hypothetical protein